MRFSLVTCVVAALAGCTHLAPGSQDGLMTGVPGIVRVAVVNISGDMARLDVINESPQETILVARDAIVLKAPSGTRTRMQGGVMANYVIPPGGHHAVNLRYDLAKLKKGEPLYLDFADAIKIGGAPVGVQPLHIALE